MNRHINIIGCKEKRLLNYLPKQSRILFLEQYLVMLRLKLSALLFMEKAMLLMENY